MYPPLFIVIIACVTTILGNTSRPSKCSNIICPAVKATICVKIKQTNNNQSQTNYVMMSKCEIKQINCFNDVKATVVPVKLCNVKSLREGELLASNDPKVPQLPSENDEKKLTQEDSNKAPDETENNDPDGAEKDTDDPQETPEDPNEESGAGIPKTENDENDATKIPREETGEPGDPQVTQDPDEDGGSDAPQTEDDEHDGTDIPHDETGEPGDPQVTQDPNEDGGSEAPHTEDDEHDGTDIPRDETGESDDHLVTQPEDLNTDDQHNEANTENGGACPQKCPIRDVMVCARCSHGVYRTFMSACYMRMYKCQNPSEGLELVSRHACIGSAPYLGEMSRPSQNLVEAQDKDPVMNYIFASRNSGHWE